MYWAFFSLVVVAAFSVSLCTRTILPEFSKLQAKNGYYFSKEGKLSL